ncbi:Histone-lysine N-methyltransferase SETD7 [Dirofilaria immitis]
MSNEFSLLPETLNKRLEHLKKKYCEYKTRRPDAPEWFSRQYNEKQRRTSNIFWAAPHDETGALRMLSLVSYKNEQKRSIAFDVGNHRFFTPLNFYH